MSFFAITKLFPTIPDFTAGPIAKNAAIMLTMRVFNMSAGFIIALILANALGANQYGVFAFCLSVASTMAVFSRLALPTLSVRTISACLTNANNETLAGLFYFVSIAAIIFTATAAIALSQFFSLKGATLSTEMLSAGRWALLIGVLMTITTLTQGILRGFGAVKTAFAPEFVFVPIILFGGIAGALLTGILTAKIAITLAVIAWGAGALIGVAITVWRSLKTITAVRPKIYWRQWLIDVMSLSAMSAAVMLIGKVDALILAMFAAPEQVGYFVFAMRLAIVASLVGNSIASGLSPVISRLYTAGAFDTLKDRIQKAAIANAAGSIVLAAAITIFAWTMLPIISPELAPAKNFAGIIALGYAIAGCAGRPFELLAMTGRSSAIVTAGASSTALFLFYTFALIPAYGAYGAALASAMGLISNALIFCIFAYRETQIRCDVVAALQKKSVLYG